MQNSYHWRKKYLNCVSSSRVILLYQEMKLKYFSCLLHYGVTVEAKRWFSLYT